LWVHQVVELSACKHDVSRLQECRGDDVDEHAPPPGTRLRPQHLHGTPFQATTTATAAEATVAAAAVDDWLVGAELALTV